MRGRKGTRKTPMKKGKGDGKGDKGKDFKRKERGYRDGEEGSSGGKRRCRGRGNGEGQGTKILRRGRKGSRTEDSLTKRDSGLQQRTVAGFHAKYYQLAVPYFMTNIREFAKIV